jgi:predicted alpha/beta-hydrolase family hydrolase
MSPDFTELETPTLVVAGDADQSPLSTRGPDWFTDAYTLSPGATALLTLTGGQHSLGGIHGYRSADTTDEDPARVELVAAASAAYLEQALGVDAAPWQQVQAELAAAPQPAGRIETGRSGR